MKFPEHIGSYRFLGPLQKYASPKKCLVGLYQNNRKTYVVKIYHLGMPKAYYSELSREFTASQTLYRLLHARTRSRNISISTPKPVKIVRKSTYTALIFEYIRGRKLLSFPPRDQARILARTINELESISLMSSNRLMRSFRNLPWWLYALSLPYVAVRAYLKNTIPFTHIATSVGICLRSLTSQIPKQIVLTHRDLLPENILVCGRKIIVVDCTHMVLTPRGYDLSYICIHEKLHGLSESVIQRLRTRPDPFFTAYICLQHAHSYNPIRNINYYAATLADLYEQ